MIGGELCVRFYSSRSPSVPSFRVDKTHQLLTSSEPGDVGADPFGEQGQDHFDGVGGVRRDDAVGEVPQGVTLGQRLWVGHVESGPRNAPLSQGFDERIGVEVSPAGHVDEPSRVVHDAQPLRSDDSPCLGCQR